jgi:hypothetical protein
MDNKGYPSVNSAAYKDVTMVRPFNMTTLHKLDAIMPTCKVYLIEDEYLVAASYTKGVQFCPWSANQSTKDKKCSGGCADYSIYSLARKRSFSVSDLHIHLIRDHDFLREMFYIAWILLM